MLMCVVHLVANVGYQITDAIRCSPKKQLNLLAMCTRSHKFNCELWNHRVIFGLHANESRCSTRAERDENAVVCLTYVCYKNKHSRLQRRPSMSIVPLESERCWRVGDRNGQNRRHRWKFGRVQVFVAISLKYGRENVEAVAAIVICRCRCRWYKWD